MNDSRPTSATSVGSDPSTRDRLIAAGRTLFARKGFDGTSIRALTALAGTNLGAVTYHFGSKEGLYTAVLEDGVLPLARAIASAATEAGSARERTLHVVEVYFEHFSRHPDLPYLLLQEVAAGKPPPPVILEILRSVKDTVAGLQVEGAADGSIRPGHPLLTALSVVSQPIYLTLIAPMLHHVGGLDLRDPATRRTAVEHTLAFVDAGLAPHGDSPS